MNKLKGNMQTDLNLKDNNLKLYNKIIPNGFITSTTEIGIKSPIVEKKQYITESTKETEESKIKIIFNNKCKSFKDKQNKFSNYIENKNDTKINNKILKLMCLANKYVYIKDLPFDLDEGDLILKDRVESIIKKSNIDVNLWKNNIICKATLRDNITKSFVSDYKKGEPFRVYFIKKQDYIEIYLLDLYHLFATNYVPTISKNYEKIKRYNICFTKLI